MLKDPNGSFTLSTGGTTYSVVMNTTGETQVINLRGDQVPWQYIQVGNMLTVTGAISGLTINARLVIVPTVKDDAG